VSFLGSFNPVTIIKNLADPLVQLAQGNISKAATSFTQIVTTGGLSTVSPQIKIATDPILSKLYDPKLIPAVIGATTKVPLLNAGGAYSVGTQPFYGSIKLPPATYGPPSPVPTQGVQPMGFDLGGLLSSVTSIFGGNQNPVFNTVSNVAGLASNFLPTPQPVAMRMPTPTLPAAGMLSRLPTIGRNFFAKYPNLATAIQGLRNAGKNISRKQLYSMLRRFGPDFLIGAGILTAAAVSELMVAGPGTRRMNPGNVKALRRSLRRLESFHHLCQRADKLRRPSRRSTRTVGRGTQQFVRQG
jgi:hypothetical protein